MRSVVILGLLVASVAVHADEAAVEYRQDIMTSVGGHMKAIVKLVKGEVDHTGDMGILATNMVGLSEIAAQIFPEGSNMGDTDALPEIWSEPEEFAGRLGAFQDAARALDEATALDDPAQVGQAVQNLGKACKSCHDQFRAE